MERKLAFRSSTGVTATRSKPSRIRGRQLKRLLNQIKIIRRLSPRIWRMRLMRILSSRKPRILVLPSERETQRAFMRTCIWTLMISNFRRLTLPAISRCLRRLKCWWMLSIYGLNARNGPLECPSTPARVTSFLRRQLSRDWWRKRSWRLLYLARKPSNIVMCGCRGLSKSSGSFYRARPSPRIKYCSVGKEWSSSSTSPRRINSSASTFTKLCGVSRNLKGPIS